VYAAQLENGFKNLKKLFKKSKSEVEVFFICYTILITDHVQFHILIVILIFEKNNVTEKAVYSV